MKLLYMIKRPLTARDRTRFGIDLFHERGWDLSVFDMSALIHPNLPSDMEDAAALHGLNILPISTWETFRAASKSLSAVDVVVFLLQSFGVSPVTKHVLQRMSREGTAYLTLAPSIYPRQNQTEGGLADRLRALRARLRQFSPQNSVLSRLPPRILGIAPSRWHVINGQASRGANNLVGPQTQLIETGTPDFDTWLEVRERTPPSDRHVLFIDQFMPFHADAKAIGRENALDAESYFQAMREYFAWVEDLVGLPVVIAAHPRSDYNQRGNPFGGRRIETGRTAELIAESRIVLAHHSTAIGLAVLFRKPVAILTSGPLMEYVAHHRAVYRGFADALGVPLTFLDRPDSWDDPRGFGLDTGAYERYVTEFIRAPGTPERKMWDIIADAITGTPSLGSGVGVGSRSVAGIM